MKKLVSILLLFAMLLSLTACHGSKEERTFAIPEEFDTTKTTRFPSGRKTTPT